MRIKLDENLPLALQSGLVALGHDVHSVFDENLAGEPDDKIWQACTTEDRFLITQDLDFSDTRKYPPGTHAGIMILRAVDDSREISSAWFSKPLPSTISQLTSVPWLWSPT